MDFISEEQSELYDRRRELAEQISSEFGDGDFFEGDSRHQELLMQLERVEKEINDFNNN